MCTWGTEKTIQITQTITVDACIADEIVALNAAGVRTVGSCCGHGKGPAMALIMPSSYARAKDLGYVPQWVDGSQENGFGDWGIVLGEGRMRENGAPCVTLTRARLRALFRESLHRYDEQMVDAVSDAHGRGQEEALRTAIRIVTGGSEPDPGTDVDKMIAELEEYAPRADPADVEQAWKEFVNTLADYDHHDDEVALSNGRIVLARRLVEGAALRYARLVAQDALERAADAREAETRLYEAENKLLRVREWAAHAGRADDDGEDDDYIRSCCANERIIARRVLTILDDKPKATPKGAESDRKARPRKSTAANCARRPKR